MNTDTENLLQPEKQQMPKLLKIVKETMSEEKLIFDNLLNQPAEILTKGQSIPDKVASFGGSWKFVILFGIILTLWILFNALAPAAENFDRIRLYS